MWDSRPRHHLTIQLIELIDLALAWAKGTSLNHGRGTVPEGVQYPLIKVEMIPYEDGRDVPKELSRRNSALDRVEGGRS